MLYKKNQAEKLEDSLFKQPLVVTQLLEAIYESAKTGKTIYFD